MGFRKGAALLPLFFVLALAGCEPGERDDLNARVQELEQQLARANSELAEREAALAELRAQTGPPDEALQRCRANVDALTARLVSLERERDQLHSQLEQRTKGQ